ncbi:DUF4349 domain-containing protein [Rubrivirga sp.]|uniref:DUF4349 domain-containing protein n=1 Tax=Rubrivirga sp. TaxID=1885344 RepID=UPI003B527DF0
MKFFTLLVLVALVGCQADSDSYAEVESLDATAYAPTADAALMAEADVEANVEVAESAALASAPSRATPAAEAAVSTDAVATDAAFASRLLRRSADLHLSTETHDETLRQARAVAGRYGGIVSGEDGSAYASAEGGSAQTTLTLRVPSDRFDAALDALAALGTVESRAVAVDDVTAQVVDVEARLRAKRAAEARYVGFVAQAGSISEMLAVQERLDGVRAEIESMESLARSLRGGVALGTIRATIVGPATTAAPPPAPGVVAQAVDAVAAGWHGVWAVVLGVLPLWPLAVVGAVGLAVWRRLSPRVAV